MVLIQVYTINWYVQDWNIGKEMALQHIALSNKNIWMSWDIQSMKMACEEW